MQISQLRLECLKLATRADRSPEEIRTIAKDFERHVLEGIRRPADTPSEKRDG